MLSIIVSLKSVEHAIAAHQILHHHTAQVAQNIESSSLFIFALDH